MTYENTFKAQVAKAASELLEKAARLEKDFIDGLVKYYSKQKIDKELSWQELINNYKTRPKNYFLSDPAISSEITPSINSHEFDSGFDSISGSNKETTKKEKSKGKKTKISNNGKTVKLVDPDMPEMIREKTEPLGKTFY